MSLTFLDSHRTVLDEYNSSPTVKQKFLERTSSYGEALQIEAYISGKELPKDRMEKYESLEAQIGDTSLVEYNGEVANGNKILLKLECDNPFGNSHYDRVYLELFYFKELLGVLKPGVTVFETTSGSAGASFAAIGNYLGYDCHVAIPEGGEIAREKALRERGATIHLTPPEEYVNGFKRFILDTLREHPDWVFINHSMGNILGKGSEVNETTIVAMEEVAKEAILQLREKTDSAYGAVVTALGNGTNTLGLVRGFEELSPETQLFGYEPFSSAVGYSIKHPEGLSAFDVHQNGKVQPQNFSRHKLPGTSFPGIDFPALKEGVEGLEDVCLVIDDNTLAEYHNLAKTEAFPSGAVKWDTNELLSELGQEYGRSTIAGMAVAKYIANNLHDSNILVLAYDRADRYDNFVKQ